MKRYLAILMVAVLLLAMLPVTSMAATQYANVVGGWLRLRSAPNFNAETLSSYYTGTQVKILGSSGGWYRVQTPDGRNGYMYGQYLRLGSSSSGGSGSSGTGNAYVTSHNGYGVRLRTGPGTGYRVIRTYDVGTPVTVLERGNYWCKLNIRGTVGYMMTQFLNFGTSPNPGSDSVVCYATVHSSNGYGVRLRTGPGKGYGKIGVYSVGTVVAVLEKGAVWDRIRVGSRVGWMMNEFLYYYNTNEVTSVTLNNDHPAVGTVLGVQAISPSGATVSYEWLVNGAKAGTGSTYTVSSTDVGKTIQLKVKGTGNYTGTAYSNVTEKVISNTQIRSVKLNTVAPVVGNVLTATVAPEKATVLYAWKVNGYQVSNAKTYTVKSSDVGKKIELIVTGTGNFSGSASVKTAEVSASSVITDVNIVNKTNSTAGAAPMVGDTLAAVTSPAQATVSYQWLLDGTEILNANQNTYQVAEGDLGKKISVVVTGTGSYTGTKTSAATLPVVEKATKPVINTVALANAYLGTNYSLQLQATGGGSMTWTLASGALPDGLTFSSDGTIIGEPSKVGKYSFSVIVKNSAGSSDEMHFTLEVTTYTVKINGGIVTTTNMDTDEHVAGNTPVQIQANAVEGKVFSNWSVTMGDATLADPNSAITTCMVTSDAEITAQYEAEDPTQGGTTEGGNTEGGGTTEGGNTEGGGTTEGGNTEGGGTTEGGNTEGGGTTEGGNTEGDGTTEGGNTEGGGTTEGGNTEGGGTTEGGNTEGSGTTEGGNTEGGGTTEGGNTEGGGTTEGGNTEGGGTTEGGSTEGGGTTEGGNTEDGGMTEGGNTEGGMTEDGNLQEGDTGDVNTENIPDENLENQTNSVEDFSNDGSFVEDSNYVNDQPEIFDDEQGFSNDQGQEPQQVFMMEPVVESVPEPVVESVPEPVIEPDFEPEPEVVTVQDPMDLRWEMDGCSASWMGESGQSYRVRLYGADGGLLVEDTTYECYYTFAQTVEPGCKLKVQTVGSSNWVSVIKD